MPWLKCNWSKIPIWSRVLFRSGTWECLVSLLQGCPSKWDVDALDKLLGKANKKQAEMKKYLVYVKQWWQNLFFISFSKQRILQRMHIKDKVANTIGSRAHWMTGMCSGPSLMATFGCSKVLWYPSLTRVWQQQAVLVFVFVFPKGSVVDTP